MDQTWLTIRNKWFHNKSRHLTFAWANSLFYVVFLNLLYTHIRHWSLAHFLLRLFFTKCSVPVNSITIYVFFFFFSLQECPLNFHTTNQLVCSLWLRDRSIEAPDSIRTCTIFRIFCVSSWIFHRWSFPTLLYTASQTLNHHKHTRCSSCNDLSSCH